MANTRKAVIFLVLIKVYLSCGVEMYLCSKMQKTILELVRMYCIIGQHEGQHEKNLQSNQLVDGWVWFQGSFYMFARQVANFKDAAMMCTLQGAYLVEIDNSTENDFVKYHLSDFKDSLWWMGLTDEETEGKFKWNHSGKIAQYFDWDTLTIPNNNNGGNENCVHFHPDIKYKWNDIDCRRTMKFICEKKYNH